MIARPSLFGLGAYSFNGKTSVSKTEVPGSSPGGPVANCVSDFGEQIKTAARRFLFLGFLMLRAFPAPVAILQEFDFALDFLLVFLAPVVLALALFAGEFDEAVLGHS